ncbi:uncharacterized protein LOC134393489, partial [Elgaria multicarinata webbii]|uniref:uncharacterized protein LOC134393489 n=1 Tax=Elgaria multicarinata webbii TaxID=159646 RepID=UPI002FCD390B
MKALLETHGPKWMTNSRLVKYRALLCENPNVQVNDCVALNPATLMRLPEPVIHDCQEIMDTVHSSRPDLKDSPVPGSIVLFTDGSSFVQHGVKKAGFAVVTEDDVLIAEALPPGTSAQKAELLALIAALEWGREKKITVYAELQRKPVREDVGRAIHHYTDYAYCFKGPREFQLDSLEPSQISRTREMAGHERCGPKAHPEETALTAGRDGRRLLGTGNRGSEITGGAASPLNLERRGGHRPKHVLPILLFLLTLSISSQKSKLD